MYGVDEGSRLCILIDVLVNLERRVNKTIDASICAKLKGFRLDAHV